MTAHCVSCGELGDPCCTKGNTAPKLKGNFCVGPGLCVDGMCTKTTGNLHQACEIGKVGCNTMFSGLKCVSSPKGGDWCDCGKGSDGFACTPASVCGSVT